MNNNLWVRGIDLSYCQRNVDYKALKKQGVSFAIIRTGYKQKTDDMLYTHLDGCISAGIKCGAYVYALAQTEDEAKTEAYYALKSIEAYKLEYPIYYYLEDNRLFSVNKEQRTKNALAFLEETLRAVYYPGIYANPAWLENYLEKEWLWGFDIWLASWTGNPEKPAKYLFGQKMWQWGLDKLEGAGNVASSICYIDYPGMIKTGGFNRVDCYRDTENMVINHDKSNYAIFNSCDKEYICTEKVLSLRKYPSENAMIIKILEKNNIYKAIYEVYIDGNLKWLYFKNEGGFSMFSDQFGNILFEEKQ